MEGPISIRRSPKPLGTEEIIQELDELVETFRETIDRLRQEYEEEERLRANGP